MVYEETWFHAPVPGAWTSIDLPETEVHHATRVLRLRPGTEFRITDGVGSVFRGRLLEGSGGRAEILERLIHEPGPPGISLALALLKGSDLEIPVEAACEFPIREVFLLRTDHSGEFKGQNFDKLLERLRRKSLVALKQAKKPWLTVVHPPEDLKTWRVRNLDVALAVAHPGEDNLPNPLPSPLHVLVGPEGGFSESELAYLWGAAKGRRLPLGPTRLRAIHAPTAALGNLMGRGK